MMSWGSVNTGALRDSWPGVSASGTLCSMLSQSARWACPTCPRKSLHSQFPAQAGHAPPLPGLPVQAVPAVHHPHSPVPPLPPAGCPCLWLLSVSVCQGSCPRGAGSPGSPAPPLTAMRWEVEGGRKGGREEGKKSKPAYWFQMWSSLTALSSNLIKFPQTARRVS